MNYSNMIEEKHLKKGFIIATLASTVIGTFTSSMGLYDKISDRRRQKKRDHGQDEEIKQLKSQMQEANKRAEENSKKIQEKEKERDEVSRSFSNSGALIRREYDEGYDRLGSRFAMGDTITENRLQAQIIAMQQTVIKVLQDAIYDRRDLTRADMDKLMAAGNAARDGTLDALRQQRQRQLVDVAPPPPKALPAPKRAPTVIEEDPLYCRYSAELQTTKKKPLAYSFAPGQDCKCPGCGYRVDAESDDYWEIAKRVPVVVADGEYERPMLEEREFTIGQRFVIKCHTPQGEYACLLCSKHRDKDAICSSVDSLINHIGRAHDVTELEREPDIIEATASTGSSASSSAREIPAALPPVPSPPNSKLDEAELQERRLNLPSKYR